MTADGVSVQWMGLAEHGRSYGTIASILVGFGAFCRILAMVALHGDNRWFDVSLRVRLVGRRHMPRRLGDPCRAR